MLRKLSTFAGLAATMAFSVSAGAQAVATGNGAPVATPVSVLAVGAAETAAVSRSLGLITAHVSHDAFSENKKIRGAGNQFVLFKPTLEKPDMTACIAVDDMCKQKPEALLSLIEKTYPTGHFHSISFDERMRKAYIVINLISLQ